VDDPEAASTEHRSECHCPHPGLVANDFATSRRPPVCRPIGGHFLSDPAHMLHTRPCRPDAGLL